jgi:hypothetical protein
MMKRREFSRQIVGGFCAVSLAGGKLNAPQRGLGMVGSKLPSLKVFDDPKHPKDEVCKRAYALSPDFA